MNYEYKSDVFSMLLQDKRYALDVYNALNGTAHPDPEEVEIQTLSSGISLTVRNDASFIIDSYLNLYEHQSTVNPNMPMRSFFYISRHIETLLKDADLYGRRLVHIPNVKCIVFYNGLEEQPEVQTLRLSDASEHPEKETDIELVCTVYNINKGKNRDLLEQSEVLRGYMTFVNYVREFQKNMNLEMALNSAIDRCIEEGVLEEFFQERRREVLKVAMLDFTFERRIELAKRDSKLEGEAEGELRGKIRGIIALGKSLNMDENEIVSHLKEVLSVNEEEALRFLRENG